MTEGRHCELRRLCLPCLALVIAETDAWIVLLYEGTAFVIRKGCFLLVGIFHIEGKTPSCQGPILVLRECLLLGTQSILY